MNRKERIQKWQRVSCTGCARCCKETIVPVTDADVKRLVKATGQSAQEIIRFADKHEIDYEPDAEAWIRLNYGRRSMVLRKKNDRCLFLDDNNRCTVYAHRPMTCRTFPLQVSLSEAHDKIEDISLNRIIKQRYPSGPKKSLELIRKTVSKEEREDERFFRKIERWNQDFSSGNKKDFLKFLGF